MDQMDYGAVLPPSLMVFFVSIKTKYLSSVPCTQSENIHINVCKKVPQCGDLTQTMGILRENGGNLCILVNI